MAHRGTNETEKLRQNVEEQMQRLLSQLEDLETEKDNLDPSEYKEMYDDTIEQLKEFKASLEKMMAGNMTLVDQLSNVKLAIQAAVSRAFHTPEVIKLFAKKEPGQLRSRLTALQRDAKLGKVNQDQYQQQRLEILMALSKLGETLSDEERSFLAANMNAEMQQFESTAESGASSSVLSKAASNIQSAKK